MWVLMLSSVGAQRALNRGHKPTEKERSAELNSLFLSAAAHVLSRNEGFLAAVAATRADPGAARRLAGRYVRSGPGRDAIELMLREAAAVDDRLIETRLANLDRAAVTVWADAPRDPGDPARDRDRQRHRAGIELLVRRANRRCLRCDARNVAGYCQAHRVAASIRRSDAEAIRNTIKALAESVGVSTYGPSKRRARRTG